MVSFELGEEIEKDVFRLVISVGQRENLSLFFYWFQNLPCLLFYLPNDMITIFYAKMERVGISIAVLGNIYSFIA